MTVTNITEFLNKFKANQQIILNVSSKVFSEGVKTTYNSIVARTPIGNPLIWKPPYWPKGYTPGSLRKGWYLNFNSTQRTGDGGFTTSNSAPQEGDLNFKVGSNKVQIAIIGNQLPYAQRVEEGWSAQAPIGMMRISIFEWITNLDKAAEKYRIK